VAGISAAITPLVPPTVLAGHVGAWVGVGGPGLGPNGTDEWLQVGLSAFPGDWWSSAYLEVVRPGHPRRYVEIGDLVYTGEQHGFAVDEVRPGWWVARLDGAALGKPVFLRGSDDAWSAIVTGESWTGGARGVCNQYAYRFGDIAVADAHPRRWSRALQIEVFHDAGYALQRAGGSFTAASAGP
jgi:hypothetical protein